MGCRGSMQLRARAGEPAPVPEGAGRELGPVVAADEVRVLAYDESRCWSRVATVASASIEWATRAESDSHVNSSVTCRILMVQPQAVTSNG